MIKAQFTLLLPGKTCPIIRSSEHDSYASAVYFL
jgi:hypothetical protein